MLSDDEIRDLGNSAGAGLQAVLKGGHLTVPETFLVQTALAAILFLAENYNRPVDNSNAPRPVVSDGNQMLKDAIGAALKTPIGG